MGHYRLVWANSFVLITRQDHPRVFSGIVAVYVGLLTLVTCLSAVHFGLI